MELGLFFEKVQMLLDKGLHIFCGKTQNLTQMNMIVLAAVGVVGLLFCFWGLKLLRIWAALLGFSAGGAMGLYASFYFDVNQSVSWIIGVAAGFILAGVSAWLYRVGAFLVSWCMGAAAGAYLIGSTGMPAAILYAGIGLVVALGALKLAAPVIMVMTGLLGGLIVGQVVFTLLSMNIQVLHITLSVIMSVVGILVQFLSESKRRKALHLKKAEEIRRESSMANEVDKARAILDNIESESSTEEKNISDHVDLDQKGDKEALKKEE